MLPLIALFAGFAFGWVRAGNRGGNRLDRLQYGAGHGIAAAIAVTAVMILGGRILGWGA